jgi:hypothetical protein
MMPFMQEERKRGFQRNIINIKYIEPLKGLIGVAPSSVLLKKQYYLK